MLNLRPSHDLKRASRVTEELPVRCIIRMSPKLHRKLKVRAAEEGMPMRAYVLRLLARDGIADES